MQEPERIVDVSWDVEKGSRFLAAVFVLGERRNKFLSEISDSIANSDGNIVEVAMNSENSLVNCSLTIEVYDINHINSLMNKIKKIPGVISVGRLRE